MQICEGLGYAHSRGVVHRDVKPANIHVSAGGKVKILDFGLARVAARETITRRGVILGTPDYMAPEQATGKGVDRRSDIFSAGAVFYEFLTLEKPFKGKTLHAVLYQIIQEDPDPLLTVNPEVPVRLAALVHGMLRKDPDQRYAVPRRRRPRARGHSRRAAAVAVAVGPAPAVRRRPARRRAPWCAITSAARGPTSRPAGTRRRSARRRRPWPPTPPPRKRPRSPGARPASCGPRARPPRPPIRGTTARVEALLARASPGKPEGEARPALAELALIAPDDARVVDLLKARGAGSR